MLLKASLHRGLLHRLHGVSSASPRNLGSTSEWSRYGLQTGFLTSVRTRCTHTHTPAFCSKQVSWTLNLSVKVFIELVCVVLHRTCWRFSLVLCQIRLLCTLPIIDNSNSSNSNSNSSKSRPTMDLPVYACFQQSFVIWLSSLFSMLCTCFWTFWSAEIEIELCITEHAIFARFYWLWELGTPVEQHAADICI